MFSTRQTAPVLPPVPAGTLRPVVESFVLLAIAVVLFRGFAAEGFMISTGSMAPTLLGYHRRVVCPDCGFQFARGASEEDQETSSATVQGSYDFGLEEPTEIRCPNCAKTDIGFRSLPRTEGDQLLVHKHAYEFRDPRRWEVIVFRNPGEPRQAYVKRVAGLPGEQIEIKQGEVFADGVLCRKPLSVQRSLRIPFARFGDRPTGDDPDSQSCWQALTADSKWKLAGNELDFNGLNEPQQIRTDWLAYSHWTRAGGYHQSSVPLAKWPDRLTPPEPDASPVQYEPGTLSCTGVLTDVERRAWLARSDDPDFHQAIDALYQRSHLTPVMDESGYNSTNSDDEHPVDEFFASLTLHNVSGEGRFEIQLRDSHNQYVAVLDFGRRDIHLFRHDEATPVRSSPFPHNLDLKRLQVEFSLFDDQAILAINGSQTFEPWTFDTSDDSRPVLRPLQLGASGLQFRVSDVTLAHDVYYIARVERGPCGAILAEDEFYVLGDNSPVSVDSRVWNNPAVPRQALIGKPLFVHLPSSSCRLTWNGASRDVRIPDFSRVRLVQ